MIKYLPFVLLLFLAAGYSDAAYADEIRGKNHGQWIGNTVIPTRIKGNHGQTERPLVPSAGKAEREIVIDKRGRRIGLASPNFHGVTNNDLLRLRSGTRVGNQIFNSAGRRVGIVIKK